MVIRQMSNILKRCCNGRTGVGTRRHYLPDRPLAAFRISTFLDHPDIEYAPEQTGILRKNGNAALGKRWTASIEGRRMNKDRIASTKLSGWTSINRCIEKPDAATVQDIRLWSDAVWSNQRLCCWEYGWNLASGSFHMYKGDGCTR